MNPVYPELHHQEFYNKINPELAYVLLWRKDKTMKRLYVCILMLAGVVASVLAEKSNSNKIFTTSRCFDLIASLQYFDKIKDFPQFTHLATDSVFIRQPRSAAF